MKTLKLVIIFTALAFIGLGCNQKKTVHQHYQNNSNEGSGSPTSGETISTGDATTEMGGETHGGDVLYARAEEIRFLLTASEEEVEEKYLNKKPWLVRRSLNQIFAGLKYLLNVDYVNDKEVQNLLAKMFDADNDKDIFYDIQEAKFKVLMPEENKNSSFWKWGDEKKNCLNIDGKASTASAKLNDIGGDICVDASRLAQEAPEPEDLLALLIHEFAHHYGADENKSRIFQNYILANVEELSNIGRSLDHFRDRNHFILDASSTILRSSELKLEVTVLEKPFINYENMGEDYKTWENELHPSPHDLDTLLRGAHIKYAIPVSGRDASSFRWVLPAKGETKSFIYKDDPKAVDNGTLTITPPCGATIKVNVLINNVNLGTVTLSNRGSILVNSVFGNTNCQYGAKAEPHPDLDPEYLTILF